MGKTNSQKVSPVVSAIYATVAFFLEVGLLFAAILAAIAYVPLPMLPAILIVVIPLLLIWSLFFSPKAVVRLRLRFRIVLMHLIYLAGAYALWLSVDHSFADQSQYWAIGMLVLTAISAILILATKGYAVPHRRGAEARRPAARQTQKPKDRQAPKGRRAAR